MDKRSFKQWFDKTGLVSVLWIMVSIIVFEIIFLTTSLERKDFFFSYVMITMSIPILLYLLNQYRIRIIRKKNRVKRTQFFDVIKIEYKTKEFKRHFLTPLEVEIPINDIIFQPESSNIIIKVGLIEKLTIDFGLDKVVVSIDELPIKYTYYYKRVRKTDDWNASSNYRMLGSNKLYSDMLQLITSLLHYGCVIDEYDMDNKNSRMVAHINNTEHMKLYDSKSPYDKKANKSTWFKSKPKTYRISFK